MVLKELLPRGRFSGEGAFALPLGFEAGAAACRFMMKHFNVALTLVCVVSICEAKTFTSREKFMVGVQENGPRSIRVSPFDVPLPPSSVFRPLVAGATVGCELGLSVVEIEGDVPSVEPVSNVSVDVTVWDLRDELPCRGLKLLPGVPVEFDRLVLKLPVDGAVVVFPVELA